MRTKLENHLHFELLDDILEVIGEATNCFFVLARTNGSIITEDREHRPLCMAIRGLNHNTCIESEKEKIAESQDGKMNPSFFYNCKVANLTCFNIPIIVNGKVDSLLLGGEFYGSSKDKAIGIVQLSKVLKDLKVKPKEISKIVSLSKEVPIFKDEKANQIMLLSESIAKYLSFAIESRLKLEEALNIKKIAEAKSRFYIKNIKRLTEVLCEVILSEDWEESLKKVSVVAKKALKSQRASIWLFDKSGSRLELFAASGSHNKFRKTHFYEKGDGVTWYIGSTGKTVAERKSSDHPEWKGKYAKTVYFRNSDNPNGAFLGVPLMVGKVKVGVIKFGPKEAGCKPYYYINSEVEYAKIIADDICNTIVIGRFYRKNLSVLQKIINLNKEIIQSRDTTSIEESLKSGLREIIDFKCAMILSWNKEEEELQCISDIGYSEAFTRRIRNKIKFKMGEGYCGKIFESKKALLIRDVKAFEEKPKYRNIETKIPLRSFVGVPMEYGGKIWGVLICTSDIRNYFEGVDKMFLTYIAQSVAVTIGRNKILAELKEKDEFLDFAIRESVDALVILDKSGQIIKYTNSVLKILGYDEDEFSELSESDLYQSLTETRRIKKAIRSENKISNMICLLKDKYNNSIKVELSGSLIVDENNSELGTIGSFRTIEEVEFEKFDKLSSVLITSASGMGHHLNNPLGAIKAYIGILLSDIENDELYKKNLISKLNKINKLAHQAQKTISEFHDLSKQYYSGDKIEKIHLKEVIDSITNKMYIKAANLTVNLHNVSRKYVLARREELDLIFSNLFENSIRHAIGQLVIDLRVEVEEGFLKIYFTNNGLKIPSNIQDNIFTPFFSTDGTRKGLGLFITLRIVRSLGGKIYLKKSKSRETTFVIKLPKYKKQS